MTTKTTPTAALETALVDVLRGFLRRKDAPDRALLASIDQGTWQRYAHDEQQRRAMSLLQSMDDQTLAAIAKREINVPAAIERAMPA